MPLVGLQKARNNQAASELVATRQAASEQPSGRRASDRQEHGTTKQRLALFAWTLLAVLVVAACASTSPAGPGNPDRPAPGFFPTAPATSQGQLTQALYPIIFYIAVAVFILVEGLLLVIVYKFRRRRSDDTGLPAQTHGNNLLEVLWTVIPTLIVGGLFLLTVDRLGTLERLDDSPAVVIDVTGFQWQWTIKYPDDGVELTGVGRDGPVMGLPVNETVRIRLQSADVIHSFYVPQFLYKKDVIPGRTNEFDVFVRNPGTYTGQCAEFCGLQHYQMFFKVQAMERPDYQAWLEEQKAAGPAASVPPDSAKVSLTAVDFKTFDPPTLGAPAGKSMVFTFQNADQSQPHNVSIVGGQPDGKDWIGLPITQPGQIATYVAPPLRDGSYEFYCAVHPTTMRGTLTVSGK